VKNAAKIEVDDTPPTVSSHATPADASLEAVRRRSSRPPGTGAYAIEPPPTVVTSPSDNGDKLANVTASTAPLPELDVKISQGVKESTIDRRIEPTYPAEALRRKVQGAVTVEVSIAENGTVSNVKILRGEPLLATAAADAIRKWRYTPTLLDGKPTAVQKEITINFKLP
jgi:TonB family protein